MSEQALYDVTITLTFPADDIDDADQQADELIEILDEKGFDLTSGVLVEESIELDEE